MKRADMPSDRGFSDDYFLENTFGLIIVLEDNYLDRKKIASLAC